MTFSPTFKNNEKWQDIAKQFKFIQMAFTVAPFSSVMIKKK
jgi:hypothetical protein